MQNTHLDMLIDRHGQLQMHNFQDITCLIAISDDVHSALLAVG